MDAPDIPEPQFERAAEIVLTRVPARRATAHPTGLAPAPPTPTRSASVRGPVLLAAGGAVVVALVVGWVARGGDGDVGTAPAPAVAPAAAAVAAGEPAPLTLSVGVPGPAVAGRPTRLVVHYADGEGVFSGSTEDWGDGVGASSLSEERCVPGTGPPRPAAPAEGSYRAPHTWAQPGTFTVRVGVSSYTCEGAGPVEEQATTTVTVEVAAR